jgi:hypothetical protein
MQKFLQMQELLKAIWPVLAQIDWALYLPYLAKPYDENGVPKYTGLLMHRRGGGCIGASTFVVGFIPRPEKSALVASKKTRLLEIHKDIFSSMERRDPDTDYWGGGIRASNNPAISYAITGFPEIGDHLLLANMMRACELLSLDDYLQVTNAHSKHLSVVLTSAGMEVETYHKLNQTIINLIDLIMVQIKK